MKFRDKLTGYSDYIRDDGQEGMCQRAEVKIMVPREDQENFAEVLFENLLDDDKYKSSACKALIDLEEGRFEQVYNFLTDPDVAWHTCIPFGWKDGKLYTCWWSDKELESLEKNFSDKLDMIFILDEDEREALDSIESILDFYTSTDEVIQWAEKVVSSKYEDRFKYGDGRWNAITPEMITDLNKIFEHDVLLRIYPW